MRLFRDEEAARKAGFRNVRNGEGRERIWLIDGDSGIDFCEILTDRERALLGALEAVVAAHYCEMPEPGEREAIQAAEALIKSMNVEG